MAKQDATVDPEVQKWLDENAISTGKADINLVVTEGQKETKIPVMKSILAVHSGLVRGLPDTDDVPIIGDHDSRTVVQYVTLCYPRLDAPVPTFSLTEITKLTRLAHWLDAPKVLDLLFGQLKTVLDNTSTDYEPGNISRNNGYRDGQWGDLHYNSTTYKAPDQDLYPAIFALKDAGKVIKLGDKLIMHFPDWFLALSETERASYNKYSFQVFVDFMSKMETIEKNLSDHDNDCRKIKDATKKFLALARHLLSFYPGTPAKGDAAAKGTGKKK